MSENKVVQIKFILKIFENIENKIRRLQVFKQTFLLENIIKLFLKNCSKKLFFELFSKSENTFGNFLTKIVF